MEHKIKIIQLIKNKQICHVTLDELTLTLITLISTAMSRPYRTTSKAVIQKRSSFTPKLASANFHNFIILVMKARIQ